MGPRTPLSASGVAAYRPNRRALAAGCVPMFRDPHRIVVDCPGRHQPVEPKAIEPVLGADSALPDVDKAVDKAGKGR